MSIYRFFSIPGESGGVKKAPSVLSKEKRDLERVVSDKSRRVKIRGNQAIVPLKFDKDGEVVESPDKLIFKRLTLTDLRFLKILRDCAWDLAVAVSKAGIDQAHAERLVKKLACFRQEDAKVKALAEIPTPDWITAKHVENVYSGGTLADSEHKSLAELAKIEGAYKQSAPTTQINVFNLPNLPPEQEAKLKEVFDTIAVEGQSHVA
jgi:hypothetical protein